MAPTIIDGIYYDEHGEPKHAGVVEVDGAIYYAGSGGALATGEKTVHGEMTNGILKRGVYRFGDDGKLVEGSYIAPVKVKKAKRKKRSDTPKAKKKKRRLILCIVAALVLFIFADLYFGWSDPQSVQPTGPAASNGDDPRASVVLPSFSDEVYLCTDSFRRYYLGEITLQKAIEMNQGAYAPFVFTYELPENARATLYLDGKQYPLDPQGESVSIDNLMTGKTYQYSVKVEKALPDTTWETTYPGSFTTADTNRFITLPGVSNTRDIGGYKTRDGKRVKQGMIIRGTEIDGLVESKYYLTDKEAAEPFHFQTDLDLRSGELFSTVYKSRLGDNVPHHFFNAPSYSGIFVDGAKPILRDIFSELAEPENYPIYLHCTYGADRTGTVVFLLQGLLGVSEEDMEKEYRLTGFHIASYGTTTYLNGIYGGLEGTPGDTINEKICAYLIREVGVTQEQIERIRSILLE